MKRGPGGMRHWARLAFVGLAMACASHDPEVERRGPAASGGATSGGGGRGGTGGFGGDGSAGDGTELIDFCQAEIVLRTVCQRCHSNPPENGAPFPLVTYEDTQEPYGTSGRRRWERMLEVVESDLMPLLGLDLDPPVEALTCEEKATLLGWLEQGGELAGGPDCEDRTADLVACPED